MRLQAGLGYSLTFTQGGTDAARAALERSLVIAEERGDMLYKMWLLVSLNILHSRNGNFEMRFNTHVAPRPPPQSWAMRRRSRWSNSASEIHSTSSVTSAARAPSWRPRSAWAASPQESGRTYLGYDYDILAAITLARCAAGPSGSGRRARTQDSQGRRADQQSDRAVHRVAACRRTAPLDRRPDLRRGAHRLVHLECPFVFAVATDRGGARPQGRVAIRRGDAQAGVDILQGCLGSFAAAHYGLMISAFHISLAEGLAATGRFAESIRMVETVSSGRNQRGHDQLARVAARKGRRSVLDAGAAR